MAFLFHVMMQHLLWYSLRYCLHISYIDAAWCKEDTYTFWGQKVKGQGHGGQIFIWEIAYCGALPDSVSVLVTWLILNNIVQVLHIHNLYLPGLTCSFLGIWQFSHWYIFMNANVICIHQIIFSSPELWRCPASVRPSEACPGNNFLLHAWISILFHRIVVHDLRVCHDLEPKSYLQGQGHSAL